jgi:phosphate transport system permease protein
MSTEHERNTTEFGRVSRVKGKIFERLSLAASVFGLLMLAILLVYVVVDAFNLSSASPEWLLTYFLTLVVPFIGFCLYSADDRELTRQMLLVLGGGMPAVAGTFVGIETFIRSIPGLTWQLIYLFGVVVPVTAYVAYAGSQEPIGRVGFGLVGRLIGGTALGFMFVILFVVFEPLTWFWAYTLGFVPAVAVLAYSRKRPQSAVSMMVAPVTLAGMVLALIPDYPYIVITIATDYGFVPLAADWVAVTVSMFTVYLVVLAVPTAIALRHALEDRTDQRQALGASVLAFVVAVGVSFILGRTGFAPGPILQFYVGTPTTWAIYAWTLAVPLSLASAGLTALQASRRDAALTGGGVFVLAVLGSQVASALGLSPKTAMLFLLAISVPTLAYVRKVGRNRTGMPGLALPVLLVGGVLLGAVIVDIWGVTPPEIWLNWSFLTAGPSSTPDLAGFYPAIVGSVVLITLVAIFSFTFGVGTAVFLEEYAPDTGVGGLLTRIIQINIANLAAVPSVVYGLLGLGLFVNLVGLGLGTAITGALTLTLLILPITIISAQEAIRAVPDSMRNGSYAMGATRWQTTKNVVLPEALPGVLTGTILSLGRAIGETAPLIMIGFPNTIFNPPGGIMETTTAMPMQIFVWSSSVKSEFRYGVLAAGVVTLLVVLLLMNATAIVIRNRSEQGP